MMRILLFLATNFAVMLVLGIILNVTGIAGNSTGGILIMAMLFGFAGSLISLFLSKTMALRSVGAEVITEPRNQAERWLVETVRRQAQQAGIPMPDTAPLQILCPLSLHTPSETGLQETAPASVRYIPALRPAQSRRHPSV